MSTTPQFIGTPKNGSSAITATANTNRDGTTGTYTTIYTAGASGGRIDQLTCFATSTTTAGMLRFFVNNALVCELPVLPVVPAGSTPAWNAVIDFPRALVMQANATLKVNTNNAEAFVVSITNGGDF